MYFRKGFTQVLHFFTRYTSIYRYITYIGKMCALFSLIQCSMYYTSWPPLSCQWLPDLVCFGWICEGENCDLHSKYFFWIMDSSTDCGHLVQNTSKHLEWNLILLASASLPGLGIEIPVPLRGCSHRERNTDRYEQAHGSSLYALLATSFKSPDNMLFRDSVWSS